MTLSTEKRIGHCTIGSQSGMNRDLFMRSCRVHRKRGYGVVATGAPDERMPGKRTWVAGFHGYDAQLATRADIEAMADVALARIDAGEPGALLNLGIVLPAGVVGIDVDDYGTKRGAATIRAAVRAYGALPPTYRVTARGTGNRSGIRLYRVPNDWVGPGALKAEDGSPGDVELIQHHLRYVTAPGSRHHTGRRYRLYGPAGERTGTVVLPYPAELPELPPPWREALNRPNRASVAGASSGASSDMAVAATWVGNAAPKQLRRTVCRVEDTGTTGGTRNATRDALCVAARKARAGVYPWADAIAEIKAAARGAYAERGIRLDEREFENLVTFAVRCALETPEAEILARWGLASDAELADARTQCDNFRLRVMDE